MTRKLKKNSHPAGMRIKMFLYFALFTAIVIAVIAIFQIFFLDKVYRMTVTRQSKTAAEKISAIDYNNSRYRESVYDIASKYGICVSVYKISSGYGTPVVTAHTQSFCIIHSMVDNGLLGNIYANAENGKTYVETLEEETSSSSGSLIAAKLIKNGNEEILTVVNSAIQPVDATVATLRYQLLYISAILLVVAAIMAIIISKRFTRPVIKMNEEAKKLALGNYNVDFEGGTFLETEELGRTLNYAADELSRLDTMQKELIANISHDLRTPLTMISGYSEVMRDIPGEMNSENMQIIIDETSRLSSLVNDMLDLSRLSGGGRELKKTVFSLTDAVKETVDRYSHLKSVDGYSIEFSPDEDIYVEADEILIIQVIYNLVSNAVNYTGSDKTVYISQSITDDICRISVTDTGEGIPEEKLPLIWDRYYRTGDYHKRAVTGTGLGLSIVKNALLLHGAQFGVSSTIGKGSTFWFELPFYIPKN